MNWEICVWIGDSAWTVYVGAEEMLCELTGWKINIIRPNRQCIFIIIIIIIIKFISGESVELSPIITEVFSVV